MALVVNNLQDTELISAESPLWSVIVWHFVSHAGFRRLGVVVVSQSVVIAIAVVAVCYFLWRWRSLWLPEAKIAGAHEGSVDLFVCVSVCVSVCLWWGLLAACVCCLFEETEPTKVTNQKHPVVCKHSALIWILSRIWCELCPFVHLCQCCGTGREEPLQLQAGRWTSRQETCSLISIQVSVKENGCQSATGQTPFLEFFFDTGDQEAQFSLQNSQLHNSVTITTPTRAHGSISCVMHTDPTPFLGNIPDEECLIAPIVDCQLSENSKTNAGWFELKIPHCQGMDLNLVRVWHGNIYTEPTAPFQRIPRSQTQAEHLSMRKNERNFYVVDNHNTFIYTKEFSHFVCTSCKKVCHELSQALIFGKILDSFLTGIASLRLYTGSQLYTIEDYIEVGLATPLWVALQACFMWHYILLLFPDKNFMFQFSCHCAPCSTEANQKWSWLWKVFGGTSGVWLESRTVSGSEWHSYQSPLTHLGAKETNPFQAAMVSKCTENCTCKKLYFVRVFAIGSQSILLCTLLLNWNDSFKNLQLQSLRTSFYATPARNLVQLWWLHLTCFWQEAKTIVGPPFWVLMWMTGHFQVSWRCTTLQCRMNHLSLSCRPTWMWDDG